MKYSEKYNFCLPLFFFFVHYHRLSELWCIIFIALYVVKMYCNHTQLRSHFVKWNDWSTWDSVVRYMLSNCILKIRWVRHRKNTKQNKIRCRTHSKKEVAQRPSQNKLQWMATFWIKPSIMRCWSAPVNASVCAHVMKYPQECVLVI